MTISSRYAVAIHILSLLEINKEERITSDFIAGSVNTNPVVIRRIIGMLGKAGLVITNPGVAGAQLARPIDRITLLDVYRAVQSDPEEELFALHDNPNPQCPVGRNIQGALEGTFAQAQKAMEEELRKVTLQQIVHQVSQEP
ncbi:Rrf2 family transcriptional regulator [Paenibacillus doosanensis]|uniref:Rrf2 family transcriptional regulator n=1 Tax=Paenibacillus doosanensis TaxID=1229154 RepID=UPI00218066B3|nr:Rrf2 family transcriptional regulator [Paenibacillus doosanensis]MCS7459575.1 Rrf2 family transcriptional regulator [Paenibacillus doosanensis]